MKDIFFDKVYFGISNKKDGSMKDQANNVSSFIEKKKLENKTLFLANLNHGNDVLVCGDSSFGEIPQADALLSNRKDALLAITVADCLPVYFFDEMKKVIGIAHAGWRGLLSGIIINTVDKMIEEYSSNPEDISVFIGPHIKSCCFKIQDDLKDEFRAEDLIFRDNEIFIDLSNIAKKQLDEKGVLEDKIAWSQDCSSCLSEEYYSFRRDKKLGLKTMLAYISFK